MGGWTFQVWSVGRDLSFFYIFFLSGKNDSPKKHNNIPENLMFFGETFQKNILSYFPKLFSQIFVEFDQKWLISHDFSKLKK